VTTSKYKGEIQMAPFKTISDAPQVRTFGPKHTHLLRVALVVMLTLCGGLMACGDDTKETETPSESDVTSEPWQCEKCPACSQCQPKAGAGVTPESCDVAKETECTGDCEWVHADKTTLCDDGSADTNFDRCDGAGGCAGKAINCTKTTTCITAWTPNGSDCTPTYADGATCDDGQLNTRDDSCSSGVCSGTTFNCPATSECTTSFSPNGTDCTPVYAAKDTTCDDGDEETTNDVCDGAGLCAGTIKLGPCAPYCPQIVAAKCTNSPASESACNAFCDGVMAADKSCGTLLLDVFDCMGEKPEWTCADIDGDGPGKDTKFTPADEACKAKHQEFAKCIQGASINCTGYCAAVAATCTEDNTIEFPTSCEASCANFPAGESGATSGNTLACRIYYLGVGGKEDPKVNCANAAPDGGGVCVD